MALKIGNAVSAFTKYRFSAVLNPMLYSFGGKQFRKNFRKKVQWMYQTVQGDTEYGTTYNSGHTRSRVGGRSSNTISRPMVKSNSQDDVIENSYINSCYETTVSSANTETTDVPDNGVHNSVT